MRRQNKGSLGSWSKWSGLTDTTSLAVSTLQDLTFLWSPFLFFQTLDPESLLTEWPLQEHCLHPGNPTVMAWGRWAQDHIYHQPQEKRNP